jgi:hypothetical protein
MGGEMLEGNLPAVPGRHCDVIGEKSLHRVVEGDLPPGQHVREHRRS